MRTVLNTVKVQCRRDGNRTLLNGAYVRPDRARLDNHLNIADVTPVLRKARKEVVANSEIDFSESTAASLLQILSLRRG